MTDPGMADVTYIEPLTVDSLERIIAAERPDAILPNLGGQTGLNLTQSSTGPNPRQLRVWTIGVQGTRHRAGGGLDRVQGDDERPGDPHAAQRGLLQRGGGRSRGVAVPVTQSCSAGPHPRWHGGRDRGNVEELRVIAARGLAASLVGYTSLEESVLGWEELNQRLCGTRAAAWSRFVSPSRTWMRWASTRVIALRRPHAHRPQRAAGAPAGLLLPHRRGDWRHRRHQHPVRSQPGGRPRCGHRDQPSHLPLIGPASNATGFPIALVSSMLAGGLSSPISPTGVMDPSTAHAPGRLRRRPRALGLREVPRRRGIAWGRRCARSARS